MNREQFLTRRTPDWDRFELLLSRADQRRTKKMSGDDIAEFSALYRALCHDLSLVQSRDWGTGLARYLNRLAAQGHHVLYRSPPGSLKAVVQFLLADFPRLLRANRWHFLLACLLLVVPGAVSGTLVARNPELAGRLLDSSQQAQFDRMYSESVSERESGMEALMAGFYVQHNVGIAFKCFALGVFAGLGTIQVLVFNSLALGTVTGFLVGKGHSRNFFEFVIGHGSFELTAIAVAGAAGLVLGQALVHPGRQTRWDALRDRGLVAVKLALGAGAMLIVAAFIEGFWSPSPAPFEVKMVVGAILWLVVGLYLGFAGRETPAVALSAAAGKVTG